MTDDERPKLPEGAAKFATALAGMAYNPQDALEKALRAWAEFGDIPFREETRNRIACAMFAALAIYLESEEPDAMGWLGLTNREFADKLKKSMAPSAGEGPKYGTAMMRAYRDGELIVLKYTEDMAVVLPADTARTMAESLLDLAGDIDDKRGTVFYFGVPPHDHPTEPDEPRKG